MSALEEFCNMLYEDLGREEKVYPDDETHTATLSFEDGVQIKVKDLSPGFLFKGEIAKSPEKNLEMVYSAIMLGNLFSESSGGGIVGLNKESKMLTLSMALPYRISFQEFRDKVEDFTNYVEFWRQELSDIQDGKQSVLLP